MKQQNAKRAAMRRAVMQLVGGVALLHAVALSIYFFGSVTEWSARNQRFFTGIWTGATALVVVTLLKRVRRVRYS